jgi:hypothetical protein
MIIAEYRIHVVNCWSVEIFINQKGTRQFARLNFVKRKKRRKAYEFQVLNLIQKELLCTRNSFYIIKRDRTLAFH